MKILNMSRRKFLKSTAFAGGGLILGFHLPFRSLDAEAQTAGEMEINAFIRIAPDNSITITVPSSEMGQGVSTSLPMIVAEDLEADWTKITAKLAPAGDAYKNPFYNMQGTGGSTSIRGWWQPLRTIGASAREMLLAAAAEQWGIPVSDCVAENGMVMHKNNGKQASYGELAEAAAKLTPPQEPDLKPQEQYRIVGQPLKRLDSLPKIDGSAVYGMNMRVPNMLIATVKVSPVFGGEVDSMDDTAAKAVKGVKAVVPVPNGVAVVAENYWQAQKGLDALYVKFNEGEHATLSSAGILTSFREALQDEGAIAHSDGDAEGALASAAKTLEMEYDVPFLAHATMSPMNCTASVTAEGCEIWAPTQSQTISAQVASQLTGLPPEKVRLHTTLLGGGFGRRFELDVLIQAVLISKAVGQPVKVVWSREEDMQHDFYRPAGVCRFRIGLDADGLPVAWLNKIVGPSIMSRVFPQFVQNNLDPTSFEGASELPYGIPHQQISYVMKDTGVPIGFWRSVGNSFTAFYVESALDEAAHAGNHDPYQFRRKLLAANPRFLNVLDVAAEKAGWGKSLAEGHFQGIALQQSFGSIVCQIAEVSLDEKGNKVRVHRVVCAVDCGSAVNPEIVKAQMESGIVYGLTAALKGEITIKKGRVTQSNFHNYRMLRMKEMPVIETYIIESGETPGGIGETGTPTIVPAVTNAIFAATGKRIRSLPIKKHTLKRKSG